MLVMQLQIGFRDVVRVGHVVVDGCSCQPVGAGAVFLRPTNCGVNRHLCHVDTLRHQFPRHALRESGLGMACHCKGTARWVAFERCACVREDDRSFGAVRVRFVFVHEPGRLLTHQERAERRVSERVERHTWVGFDYPLSEDVGNPAVDVVYDKRRRPEVSNDILEQRLHESWFACVARVSTNAVSLLQVLQDRLSGFLAATPTRMPLFANSLAQLELIPGPPPTISATSCIEGCVPGLSDWVIFVLPFVIRNKRGRQVWLT